MGDARLVWTSDPEAAKQLREDGKLEVAKDSRPEMQTIRVALDRKRRAGKTVTVASGFQLSSTSLTALASQLKKRCGAGGKSQQTEIEIQGDHAEAVIAILSGLGYRIKRT